MVETCGWSVRIHHADFDHGTFPRNMAGRAGSASDAAQCECLQHQETTPLHEHSPPRDVNCAAVQRAGLSCRSSQIVAKTCDPKCKKSVDFGIPRPRMIEVTT